MAHKRQDTFTTIGEWATHYKKSRKRQAAKKERRYAKKDLRKSD
jgi:hypothetical protein